MPSFNFENRDAFRFPELHTLKTERLDTRTRIVKMPRAETCYLIEKREIWVASDDGSLVRRLREAYERRAQNDR